MIFIFNCVTLQTSHMEEWNYLLYTVGEFISWGLGSSLQGIPGLGLHSAKQKVEIVERENVNSYCVFQ